MSADTGSWNERMNGWYEKLDAFINAAERDKSQIDLAAWATQVNKDYLQPIDALYAERFGAGSPVKMQMLDPKAKKKDDHLKKLKANRYAMYTQQRKDYLESVGDLG